jgi:hypothetical protein
MISRTHFLTEFDLHLVDLTFVPYRWFKDQGFGQIWDIFECHFPCRDSHRFKLPGHCGIFTAEMCAIHFAYDLIESSYKMRTLFLQIAWILPGLRSTYLTNAMLFRT